jgi:hypothetical protein
LSEHLVEHEELVRQFLCGERTADDPALHALRARCADCNAALERLDALDSRLTILGRQLRADLVRAHAETSLPEVARVRRSLEAALAGRVEHAPARPARARYLVWLAAAAALLASLWLARGAFRAPDAPTPEFLLGPGQGTIECLAPLGAGARYDEFRWRDVRPPSGWFRLTIRPLVLEGPERGRVGDVVHTEDVPEPRWTPTPEVERSLPEAIHYQVQAFDAVGRAVPEMRGDATASR